MSNEINKTIEQLKFTSKVESYPILRGLRDIKEFYMPLAEGYLNEMNKIEQEKEQNEKERDKNQPIELLKYLKVSSEIKTIESNIPLNRSSTLLILSAFIEHVFMKRIFDDVELLKKYRSWEQKLKKMGNEQRSQYDLSTIGKAVYVIGKEFDDIALIDLQYVKNMNTIRNNFIHQYGMIPSESKKKKELIKVIKKYDAEIVEGKIVLGENFIPNYIEHLEELSFEVAKILYDDESFTKRFLDENPQFKGISERIKLLGELDSETVDLIIKYPWYVKGLLNKSNK